jgi:hypothetical protein
MQTLRVSGGSVLYKTLYKVPLLDSGGDHTGKVFFARSQIRAENSVIVHETHPHSNEYAAGIMIASPVVSRIAGGLPTVGRSHLTEEPRSH